MSSNFDLRKFLTENRLTSVSRDSIDELEIKTVDRGSIRNLGDRDKLEDILDGPAPEQTLSDIPRDPVFDAKMRSLAQTIEKDPLQYRKMKVKLLDKIGRLKMNLHDKKRIKNEIENIYSPVRLSKWYEDNVLQESDSRSQDTTLNEQHDMNNFDIKKFLIENKLTALSRTNSVDEDIDNLFTEETHYDDSVFLNDSIDGQNVPDMDEVNDANISEVNKYLNMESAEDIISEIEKDISKTTMEAKLQKIKEVIEAIDEKVNSLEEDSNVKDYVSPVKLKEMRRTNKQLRKMQDRYLKEYDKKFNMKKSKS